MERSLLLLQPLCFIQGSFRCQKGIKKSEVLFGKAVFTAFKCSAKVAKHTSCIYGSQLIRIAQQDEPACRGDRVQQFGKQGEPDHRGFIDDNYLKRQWVFLIMLEKTTLGSLASQ